MSQRDVCTVMGLFHNESASVGDIDGDGDLDIFLAVGSWDCGWEGMRTSRFLINDGQGYFIEETGRIPALYEENGRVSIARLADVDKDGNLDLVLGTLNGFPWSPLPQDRILLNDGTGNFLEAPATTMPEHLFPNGFSDSMEVADFNGDGYPDFLMGVASTYGNDSAGRLRLLLNNGDGTYVDASDKISILYPQEGGYRVRKIFVGDFNGDGWLDFGSTMETGWGSFRAGICS